VDSNSRLAFGGEITANTAATEEYDGSTWTTTTSMTTARSRLGGAGTLQAGLAFGGYTATRVANTEEYNSTMLLLSHLGRAAGI
jgi:hypothetical protein